MIKLNNSNDLIEKFTKETFPEKIPFVKIDESGSLESPNITDSNIQSNSTFIVNLFDSNSKVDKPNTLKLTKK